MGTAGARADAGPPRGPAQGLGRDGGPRPWLGRGRAGVGSESWLAALALLDLSPAVQADVARFAEWSRRDGHYTHTGGGDDRVATFHPTPVVAWDEWLADVDERPRGWSTTEHSLAQVVAALVDRDRTINLHDVLGYQGSYEGDVWRILTTWGTGGNNRDQPGRYTVDPARGTASLIADQAEQRSTAGRDESHGRTPPDQLSAEPVEGQRASIRATAEEARGASDRWSALVDQGPGYDDAAVERARDALLSALADSAEQVGNYLADQPVTTPPPAGDASARAEAPAAQDALWNDLDLHDPAGTAGPADPDGDLSGAGTAPDTHDARPVSDAPARPSAMPAQPAEDAGPEPRRDDPRTSGPEAAGPSREEAALAAADEETAEPHAARERALEQARAAVAQAGRTATRRQASTDRSERVIDDTPPAYWAEPGIGL